MPQRAPVGEMRYPYVKEAKDPDVSWWDSIANITPESNYSTIIHTGNLWDYASDGSQWVHTDAVICVQPKTNTHLITTLPTNKVDVPITVYLSINVIS